MKKRISIVLLLALLIIGSFSGCGNEKKASENKEELAKKEEMADKEGAEEEKQEKDNTELENETEEVEVKKQKVSIISSYDAADIKGNKQISIMQQMLEEKEYIVEVCNEGEQETDQSQQILDILENETDAMIIVPENPYALEEALSQVKEAGIPVFSYDTLIMNTDAVNYYTTFDTRAMGNMMATEIVKAKELEKAKENNLSYTIEFLMGKPEDSRELFFFNGIMEVLQPYLEEGILQCKSGEITFDKTCVMDNNESLASKEFEKILDTYYDENTLPDIICLADDTYINGIIDALEEKEFTTDENWPFIAGRGCQAETVKRIAEGKVAFSLFADERALAEKCVELVDLYLKGEEFEVQDYHQYDNGVKIVGTNSPEVKLIDKDNYQLLIDNGYYLAEEIS